MPSMIGGCLCGDVRYSASGEPGVTSICHCLHCQKLTGSAFVEVVAVPEAAFSIQGDAANIHKCRRQRTKAEPEILSSLRDGGRHRSGSLSRHGFDHGRDARRSQLAQADYGTVL